MQCWQPVIHFLIIEKLRMEPYKIIDVHSVFFRDDSFRQKGTSHNESNEDDFFTGYAAAEKYLSPDFDCPLNRLLVNPTGIKERPSKKQDKKENYNDKISGS